MSIGRRESRRWAGRVVEIGAEFALDGGADSCGAVNGGEDVGGVKHEKEPFESRWCGRSESALAAGGWLI